ncbi:heterokaryon incompatibility protein-domain-containing protein [Xylariaceae sp. FL0016]|nr:heterokaryon incompatibility protein-domain-containing protein [Xylariaceae sp. FL0016]
MAIVFAILFWVVFTICYPYFFRRMVSGALAPWIVLEAIRYVFFSSYEISTPVYWILFVLLLLPTLGLGTLGGILFRMLITHRAYYKNDATVVPDVHISHHLIALIVIGWMLFTIASYCDRTGIPAFIVLAYYLYPTMYPLNPDFDITWGVTWWLAHYAVTYAMAPGMSLPWYTMWLGVMLVLGRGIHPQKSKTRLLIWAVLILILRFMAYAVYVGVKVKPLLVDMWPFKLVSQDWMLSKSQWYPVSLRNVSSQSVEGLCERCDELTRRSKLIMGSTQYLTPMTEWHGFWDRAEFCSMFGTRQSPSASNLEIDETIGTSCGLCYLLWFSMSVQRRREMNASNLGSDHPNFTDLTLPRPNALEDKLRVKIWEERPTSLYSYAQLHWGNLAIGARLLIHRDDLFSTASSTVRRAKTDSDLHFKQAKTWLETCQDGHNSCKDVGKNAIDYPTRLICLRSGEDWKPGDPPGTLKLVRSRDMHVRPEYVAFSHCWGPMQEMRFKLLERNIEQCYRGIDLADLSQNMQDAIITTLALGYSYIWIDCLCIIQKDETTEDRFWREDWAAEAKKMGGVYSGAACTIASTGSSSSNGGCFHERSCLSLKPCKIGVSSPDDPSPSWIYARQDDVFDFERNVDLAPLNTRGWVMQERLLSRRILHFGAEMMYWECRCRSASELNPQGYTYKEYPEDFKDWYAPNTDGQDATRRGVEQAEREGRGFTWMSEEMVRRRPPPVMIDPDMMLESQAIWQRKRGFWKNVLKRNDEPWSFDESSGHQNRAGFRAAFERLRTEQEQTNSGSAEAVIGRHSFSQMWYDVVESYSRRKLTASTDKLIALKGIEDEVAGATKFTYLYGLWKERLLTDLLWFAIEGPGYRLLDNVGQSVAPTWSWASIDGTVALDLLPENTLRDIKLLETLVSILDAPSGPESRCDMKIKLSGPLFFIRASEREDDTWKIIINGRKPVLANVFLDVQMPDPSSAENLMCLPFFVLDREKSDSSTIRSPNQDVQGLIVRLVSKDPEGWEPDRYERVGYFTTSYIAGSGDPSSIRTAFKKAAAKTIYIVG